MDDIIKAINSALELEKKVEYYFTIPGDKKRVFLEGLKKEKNEDIGIFLNAIYLEENDKEVRKLIRKLIFRLRSSGLSVQEPASSGGPVLKKIEETRENRGFMTNFDLSQSRTVMAAYEIKKNTFVFLNGEVHFRDGLLELMSAPVDRKGLGEIMAAYKNNTGKSMFLTEISPSYAAFIVEEGSRRSGRFSDGIKPLRSFVAHLQDTVHKPDDIYSLPVDGDVDPLPVEDILLHPLFTPFFLTWGKIGEDRKEYGSAGTAAIVLPQHMIEEKKSVFIKGLTGRNEIKAQIPLIKRMLEDYAYFFHIMGDHGRYLGIIRTIKDGNALADILVFFLKKSLDESGEKPAEGGLIINPYG